MCNDRYLFNTTLYIVLGSMSACGPLAAGGQEVYREITLEEGLQLPRQEYQHAAHVMLYAEWKENLYGRYPFQYAVMVTNRRQWHFGPYTLQNILFRYEQNILKLEAVDNLFSLC